MSRNGAPRPLSALASLVGAAQQPEPQEAPGGFAFVPHPDIGCVGFHLQAGAAAPGQPQIAFQFMMSLEEARAARDTLSMAISDAEKNAPRIVLPRR